MGIQEWSEYVILVHLAQEPDMGEELATTIQMIRGRDDKDVVVDFAEVDIITSSSLSKLLKLRKALADSGRRLVLSSVRPQTYSVFRLTGLDSVFSFVQDLFLALAGLQMASQPD